MTDTPPDRLSNNPKSPYYEPEHLMRGIGIRFNGVEKTNVDEYCVSEGWVKMAIGKTVDRKGNPLTITAKGTVEPYYQTAAPEADIDPASVDGDA
ncbi:DUF3297 family protein [Sphingomonas solaris]|uniref:DUF3297 family protein n=1 Tax=Alterirhizorhabdus solaris TaxID=2529389 RepID=A0A558R326_9SPHN|nr:DUF3297 family protein [Sphingomonas solaris]TVV73785.1 DUF3297 family protein [Sphingomonas solaris]